jgi:hypothetical protein
VEYVLPSIHSHSCTGHHSWLYDHGSKYDDDDYPTTHHYNARSNARTMLHITLQQSIRWYMVESEFD